MENLYVELTFSKLLAMTRTYKSAVLLKLRFSEKATNVRHNLTLSFYSTLSYCNSVQLCTVFNLLLAYMYMEYLEAIHRRKFRCKLVKTLGRHLDLKSLSN